MAALKNSWALSVAAGLVLGALQWLTLYLGFDAQFIDKDDLCLKAILIEIFLYLLMDVENILALFQAFKGSWKTDIFFG